MDNPEYVQIDNIRYKINTDFRNAFKFERIMVDNSISDYEKILGGICTLFGEEGIKHEEHYERLLKCAFNYIQGRPNSTTNKSSNKKVKKDMDYIKDWGLISASMRSEYGIDINNEKMHWWTFFDLLNGLSTDCILNRVRDIRNRDISKEKDREAREQLIELKRLYSLDDDKRVISDKEKESLETFYKLTGIERKE